jgi:ammonia channel protein AmtB
MTLPAWLSSTCSLGVNYCLPQGSDIVWMLFSSAFVLLMIPGISLFYAGVTDRSSTLTLLRLPFITAAFAGFQVSQTLPRILFDEALTSQWFLWGYSLTFSSASGAISWYGTDKAAAVFKHTSVRPVGADGAKIPELLYAFYQCMFASFT